MSDRGALLLVVLEGVPGNDSEIKQAKLGRKNMPLCETTQKIKIRIVTTSSKTGFLVAFSCSGTSYLLHFCFFPLCNHSIRQHSLRPTFTRASLNTGPSPYNT